MSCSPSRVRITCAIVAAIAAAIPVAGEQCVQLPPGAVAWWPGDGTFDDIVGGHDAVDATQGWFHMQFSPGHVGQAFDFSDGDAAMYALHHPDLNFSAEDEYSILLWMKTHPVNDDGGDLTMIAKWNSLQSYPYTMRITPRSTLNPLSYAGTIMAASWDTVNSCGTRTSRVFDDDAFHHVSAVFRHSIKTTEIHADGMLAARKQHTVDLGPIGNSQDLWFGLRGNRGSSTAYDGVLDEIMIFERALSACEIREVYAAESAGACRGDGDGDGLNDYEDNCPLDSNAAQADSDLDGVGDDCDCAPNNPSHSVVPPEVCALSVDLDGTTSKLAWTATSELSGDGTRYDVLRGYLDELPVGTGVSEQCLYNDLDLPAADDPFVPASMQGVWYLVRAVSQCGEGPWGLDSSGLERISAACP